MEIIDDEELDFVLFFHAAGFAADLVNREARGVVEVEGPLFDFFGGFLEGKKIFSVEFAFADAFKGDAGCGGEDTEHELWISHFQRKDADGVAGRAKVGVSFFVVALPRCEGGEGEGEGGLPYTRASGEDNHVAILPAGGIGVEFSKWSGDAAEAATIFLKIFDEGESALDFNGGRGGSLGEVLIGNLKDLGFGVVEDSVNVVRRFGNLCGDIDAGLL